LREEGRGNERDGCLARRGQEGKRLPSPISRFGLLVTSLTFDICPHVPMLSAKVFK
jgi:hypothetical protein